MKRGRVILVGAGPGAPELITVRGAAALREADAVVYDALASPDLLALAPPEAQRIDVGKRGHEAPTMAQEDTNALLLRLAAKGLTVVRLKGGDPFVFGRGGEEASACAEAGIPIEVVPGVSSSFGALAYAGIPVTDRRYGASFAVVTGHKDPTKVTEETRWDLLANAADTLIGLFDWETGELLDVDDDDGTGLLSRIAYPIERDGLYAIAVMDVKIDIHHPVARITGCRHRQRHIVVDAEARRAGAVGRGREEVRQDQRELADVLEVEVIDPFAVALFEVLGLPR